MRSVLNKVSLCKTARNHLKYKRFCYSVYHVLAEEDIPGLYIILKIARKYTYNYRCRKYNLYHGIYSANNDYQMVGVFYRKLREVNAQAIVSLGEIISHRPTNSYSV